MHRGTCKVCARFIFSLQWVSLFWCEEEPCVLLRVTCIGSQRESSWVQLHRNASLQDTFPDGHVDRSDDYSVRGDTVIDGLLHPCFWEGMWYTDASYRKQNPIKKKLFCLNYVVTILRDWSFLWDESVVLVVGAEFRSANKKPTAVKAAKIQSYIFKIYKSLLFIK